VDPSETLLDFPGVFLTGLRRAGLSTDFEAMDFDAAFLVCAIAVLLSREVEFIAE
jgi:hypothetical protein